LQIATLLAILLTALKQTKGARITASLAPFGCRLNSPQIKRRKNVAYASARGYFRRSLIEDAAASNKQALTG
jgi:hypothetical protein